MKMVKSLILGSAAGLVAMSGAQAADLPVKAKAVEYVRICSLYGAGFYYIPGTDTCIKLGGYLRVETAFNGAVFNGAYGTQLGAQNRFSNYYTARSRQDLTIDTRTATEYGVVRTFFDATFSWTTGSYAGRRGRSRAPPCTAAAAPALVTPLTVVSLAARSASTMRSSSSLGSRWVRRFPRSTLPGSTIRATTSTVSSAAAATVTAVNQLTYTAQFGNGVSGTLAVVDPTAYHQGNLFNLGTIAGGGLIANNVHNAFTGGAYGVNDFRRYEGSRHHRSAQGRPGLGYVPVLGCRAQQPRCLLREPCGCHIRYRIAGHPDGQVGLGRAGCLADQEHPDWCG